MLSKAASSTIFWVFVMTRPRIEPQSPGPLANTLLITPMVCTICIYWERERERETDRQTLSEREKERKKERKKERVCIYVCVCVCMLFLVERYTMKWTFLDIIYYQSIPDWNKIHFLLLNDLWFTTLEFLMRHRFWRRCWPSSLQNLYIKFYWRNVDEYSSTFIRT